MASSSEDELMANGFGDEDDLFGDEDVAPVAQARELDRELDSGDDEDQNDHAQRGNVDELDENSARDARILESTVWRHPVPKPLDGELNTLRLPKFLGIEPRAYKPEAFVPPTTDHHSDTKSSNFSASMVASSTLRYRKNPVSGNLESNTIMYKWSDGSMTISVGNQHYELQTKPLAPPLDSKSYQEVQDSHSYLASPSIASQLLIMIGHMNNQYTVRPNKEIEDDALEKLQRSLAAATRGGTKGDDRGGPELITHTQDPELQKRKAEIAEKERMKAQRRRENAAEKQNLPRVSSGTRGGLSIDDLEGRAGRRVAGAGRKARKPRRARSDYDSDDEPRAGRSREDEYDKEDDFLADSDEEVEEGVEEDEEDEIGDDSERDEPEPKKQKTSRPVAEDLGSDVDADADLDDEDLPAPVGNELAAGRGRKRNIIEDEDDE